MVTPAEAKDIIDAVGIKRQVFARRARLHPVLFSEWMNDRRTLNVNQLLRIETELEKIKTIM